MSLGADTNTNEDNGASKTNFIARHKILTGLLIAIVAIVGWWKIEFPSATWRYKMTVTVETPEGLKTGSVVREVHVRTEPKILPEASTINFNVRGEAITIDMGHGKFLFAIMDSDGSPKMISAAFPYSAKDDADYVRHYSSLHNEKTTLSATLYPTFVTFKDIRDPKTVELVYGGKFDFATQKIIPVNNFENLFGKNVNLKTISIEMADENVTWGIENYLSWLPKVGGGYLDGQFAGGGPDLSNILHGGHFKRK